MTGQMMWTVSYTLWHRAEPGDVLTASGCKRMEKLSLGEQLCQFCLVLRVSRLTISAVHFQDSSSNLYCIFHGLIQEPSVA